MNKKRFANTILVSLVIILAGAVFYLTLVKKPVSSPVPGQTTTSPQQSNSSRTSSNEPIVWNNLIPEIKMALGSKFLNIPVEEERSLSVYPNQDITGDGIPEALVDLGTGGAYTYYLTLMILENGKPVVAQFKQQDGKVSPLMFLEGASVRHGEQVTLVSDKHAIYSGSWSIDDNGKVESCTVTAYQWNSLTKTFDFSLNLSNQIKPDFCSKVHS